MKKENRGGVREGSGRKPRYKEKTERIYFTVPVSAKEEIVKKVNGILKKHNVKTTPQ